MISVLRVIILISVVIRRGQSWWDDTIKAEHGAPLNRYGRSGSHLDHRLVLKNIVRGTTDPGYRVYNLSYLSS